MIHLFPFFSIVTTINTTGSNVPWQPWKPVKQPGTPNVFPKAAQGMPTICINSFFEKTLLRNQESPLKKVTFSKKI